MPLAASETRVILAGALLALFLAALEQTVIATALTSIAADLGGFSLISWIVTAYLLSAICATPIFGKLSDILGRRRILIVCLALFLGGSALCALAPDMLALILARGIQGLGGGGLITLAQTIVADVVSPRERGRYSAYFSAVWMSAALLGPALGGFLAEHAGWPWIFWINLPLGLVVMLLSDRALRRLPVARRRAEIDYPGLLLLSAGTIALLLILSFGGRTLPWTGPQSLALCALSGAAFAALIWRQRIARDPILPPAFLTDRVVGPVLGAGFLVFGAYLAVVILSPLYCQIALGLTAGESGLMVIPMLLAASVSATLAGQYNRRTARYRLPPLVSLPLAIAGCAVLAAFGERLGAVAVSVLLAIAGLGMGSVFPCSIVAAQSAVAPRDLGAVSGAVGFARSLGGAVMVAAATSLVLDGIARALPQIGAVETLEGLASAALSPEARLIAAGAFTSLFAMLAVTLALGLAIFACIEERALHAQSGHERGLGE